MKVRTVQAYAVFFPPLLQAASLMDWWSVLTLWSNILLDFKLLQEDRMMM